MRKRAYSTSTNANKSARMVGGRVLSYRPSAPVAGSYRSRISRGAVQSARAGLEVKGVDVALTQALGVINTTTTNANCVLLNAIAPGSGSFNRIGRKAHLKSLRLKGSVEFVSTPSAAGIIVGNWMRMVVVWDQQPSSGTIPTWDVIFGLTDQAGTETSTTLAPLRYDNMDRFKVLCDKIIDYQVQPSTPVSTALVTEQITFDEFISLGNRECVFSGQSATCTIADISTGGLYVYFRANTNTAGANQCAVAAQSFARLRYSD